MNAFREAVDAAGLSLGAAARWLGCNRRTVERWYSGTNQDCPPQVIAWAQAVAEEVASVPVVEWRKSRMP